jgi:WD40 repeat protein
VKDVVLKLNLVESSTEWILMCESPYGATSTRVPLPFTEAELTSALHEVETSLIRSYSKVLTRRTVSPEKAALEFGSRLAEVLLDGDIRVLFEDCRRRAKEQRGRVRVLLETDGATVSQIPWEFAVDPKIRDDYLALRLSFARYLRVSTPVPPLSVTPPLRVLGVHAHPSDRAQLDIDQEQESVAALGSVSSDLVDVTWLDGDRWSDLSDALETGGWHILHFIGHGGFDEELGSGFLELSDHAGAALRVPAAQIGAAAAQTGDLRLVVLNACESASTSGAGVFSSTAAKLMREGIPAVVAMQYEITDPAALAFAAAFYETLARGIPVDRAVTKGREIVRITQNSLEWATPVLFLASDDAHLFDVQTSKEEDGSWDTTLIEKLPKAAPEPDTQQADPRPEPSVVRRSATPPPEPVRQQEPPAPDVPEIRQLHATAPLVGCREIALGPGDLVAMAGVDGSVRAWSLRRQNWASRCLLPRGIHATHLTWSPWPRHVATAQDDGTVVVWDLEKEVSQRVIRPSVPGIASLAFTSSGTWLVVVGTDRSVHVFDAKGELRRRLQIPATGSMPTAWGLGARRVGPCVFAPGDRSLVVTPNNGPVVQVDVKGQVLASWPHQQEVHGLAVSTHRVVTGSADGRLRFWDWGGRRIVGRDVAGVEHVAFSADGGTVATTDGERRLRLWSADGEELGGATLAGRPVGIGFGATFVVTGTQDGVLETWSTSAVVPQRTGS